MWTAAAQEGHDVVADARVHQNEGEEEKGDERGVYTKIDCYNYYIRYYKKKRVIASSHLSSNQTCSQTWNGVLRRRKPKKPQQGHLNLAHG